MRIPPKILLSLDLSDKTGWSIFIDGKYSEGGTLFPVKTRDDCGAYPHNYVRYAKQTADRIRFDLIYRFKPDQIVIEETNKARAVLSQKGLEWLHFALLDSLCGDSYPISYIQTGVWRDSVNSKQNAEERKLNSKISRLKKQRNDAIKADASLTPEQRKAAMRLPVKIDGKVVGKKNRKHTAIRVCNELFGLNLKKANEDQADSMLLAQAWLNGSNVCDGKPGRKKL